MKKLILLLGIIFLVTGCNITTIKENGIDDVIESAFDRKVSLVNTYFEGYKFYLPRGVKLLDKSDYNSKIQYKGNNYYIYVDVISYYNKQNNKIKLDDNSYYKKEFDYQSKKGYIEIDKVADKYFLQIYYNYAKVEAYVKESDIEDSIIQIGSILSSLTFNDEILESIIGENVLDYKEENYRLFNTKKDDTNFLEYIDEYDKYNGKDDNSLDEDNIDTDLTE